ncbi:MFS transporter [Dryocola sp. BD626]|jgi:ACS family hexuronate transporter-like MFS transporter|uniref:MFS transporter n=1 Tax=Dryocola sp. BD626 TaxID=3133273 RepID=UPI003F50B042
MSVSMQQASCAVASRPKGWRRNLRWYFVILFMLGVVLNYVTRNSLGVLAPELMTEMGMTTEQYSWVVAAFQTAYIIFQPICGWFMDVVGLKIGFGVLALLWSLICVFHAGAGNWIQLAVLRFFMGSTEAASGPANMKVMTEWFPRKERSIANGWGGVGFSLGAMIAPPLIVVIHMYWGWQAAFVVPGIVGVLWVGLWFWVCDTPAKSKHLSEEERNYILSDQDPPSGNMKQSLWRALWSLLKVKKFYGIALPAFMAEPAWQALSFWVPIYMMNDRGMSLKEIAMFGWLPFLLADFGSIAAGHVTQWLHQRFNITRINSAVLTSCSGALIMTSMMSLGFIANPYIVIFIISLAGFAHTVISGMLGVLVMESFEANQVATVNGLRGTFAWIGGCIFSLLIGALYTTVGFTPLFSALGLFDVIGAVIMVGILYQWGTGKKAAASV